MSWWDLGEGDDERHLAILMEAILGRMERGPGRKETMGAWSS